MRRKYSEIRISQISLIGCLVIVLLTVWTCGAPSSGSGSIQFSQTGTQVVLGSKEAINIDLSTQVGYVIGSGNSMATVALNVDGDSYSQFPVAILDNPEFLRGDIVLKQHSAELAGLTYDQPGKFEFDYQNFQGKLLVLRTKNSNHRFILIEVVDLRPNGQVEARFFL